MKRRILLLAFAGIAAAAAVVAVLMAVDVRRWNDRIRQDDLAYLAGSAGPEHWQAKQIVPFHVTEKALGIQRDLAFRHALRLFRVSRPRVSVVTTPNLAVARSQAQAALTEVLRSDADPHRRSIVANLLGVLSFTAGIGSRDINAAELLQAGIASFQTAVRLDPENDDAKFNLELALLKQRDDPVFSQNAGKPSHGDQGNGAGTGDEGRGY
jgi:hypothetical protein